MRGCIALLLFATVGCHRDDPSKIEKTSDPPAPTATKSKTKPTPGKGGCVDAAYDDKRKVGETTIAAFSQETSPPPIGLGTVGTPPPPAPYTLDTFVEDSPLDADATIGVRALCDDHPKIRACFDAVRGRLAFGDFVEANVTVDEKGRLESVKGAHDEKLEACLLDAIAAADLPKPSARGTWRLRFEIYQPQPADDPGSLDAVVRKMTPHVKRCFETALATTPKLTGKLVVHLVLDADGNVSTAAATPGTTIGDPAFVSCALSSFKGAKFPPGAPGRQIDVPFSFTAK